MKKFRWILLSGLLVATTQIAQAQPTGGPGSSMDSRMAPSSSFPSSSGSPDGSSVGSSAEAGSISNIPAPANSNGVAPDGSNAGGFVAPDDAASGSLSEDSSSSIPNTGGEPMIAVLAGLSIAGAAVMMRRKVSA